MITKWGKIIVAIKTIIILICFFSVAAAQKPNLTPYQPPGFSDKIILTKTPCVGNTDDSPIYDGDILYVAWWVINNGSTPTKTNAPLFIYLDGNIVHTNLVSPIQPGQTSSCCLCLSIGPLTTGMHTIKILVDSTNVIDESDESDNEHIKTFEVIPLSIENEIISKPDIPLGPNNGFVNSYYCYSTGGSSSNLGHNVQYLFDWGDGEISGWLPIGATSACKFWRSPGIYSVKAKARCLTHTPFMSDWSETTLMNISPSSDKPNLIPYQPYGYSDRIIITKMSSCSSYSDDKDFYTTDKLYLRWWIMNSGSTPTITNAEYKIYLDDQIIKIGIIQPLGVTWYTGECGNLSIGPLSPGIHSIKIVADSNNNIDESDETDNEYIKTIFVKMPQTLTMLYDDFSSPEIDLSKWRQGEVVKEIREFEGGNNKLYLKTKTFSPVAMTGFPFNVRNNLGIVDPDSINSIQAEVTVLESSVSGNGRTYAYLGGRFYNDGTPGGGYTGDIWAEVNIRRASDGLMARYYIAKYTTPDGSALQDLKWGAFSTPITEGIPYTLYIEYNSLINQFTFKVGTETIVVGPSNIPPRVGPPNMPWKGLHTLSRSYTSTDTASISATFDDVYVNGTPYDDFSSQLIDSSKWIYYEFAREIEQGKLRLGARSSSSSTSTIFNHLDFIDPSSIEGIKAEVTLIDRQNDQGIESVTAYVGGIYYNDGTPGGGYIGDVIASIGIGGSGENPIAGWRISKFIDSSGQTTENLADGLFSKPVSLGETYDLFIKWDGSKFIFKIDDETAEYVPTSTINPPNNPRRELATIIRNPQGKEGIIEALFDNVYIQKILYGDFDKDGDVDGVDLATFASEYGRTDCSSSNPCYGDFDNDGDVDKDDLAVFANNFGKMNCPQ